MTAARRKWTCPVCGDSWSIPAAAADPERCPKCREEAAPTTDAAAPALPFSPEDLQDEFPFAAGDSFRLRRVSSPNWTDLFDWRFERYLTPMIIRVVWIGFLLLGLLTLAYSLADFVCIFALEKGLAQVIAEQLEPAAPDGPKARVRNSAELAWLMIRIVFSVVCLMMIRVICEFFIVAFNVATSLQRLEGRDRTS